MRERCTCVSAAAEIKSTTKSRSDTASMLLAVTDFETSARATIRRSSGSVLAASAPAPSGITQCAPTPAQSLAVAAEHLDVGEDVMASVTG